MIFYHGTTSLLPFKSFDKSNQFRGLVSTRKFNGYFFTSEIENAAFFTEYLLCKVDIKISPQMNYKENILDGAIYSNILFVPSNQMDRINILEWFLVCERKYYNHLLRTESEIVGCFLQSNNYHNPYGKRMKTVW